MLGGRIFIGSMARCRLLEKGFLQGSCITYYKPKNFITFDYLKDVACKVTLKEENGVIYRLIRSILLSRPEDYLSIYQSGCNLNCKKCHSWEFTKYATGSWVSPKDIAKVSEEYAKYVTVREPKSRATSFHAHDLCRHCGYCVIYGKRSELCPGVLSPDQILLSPQGYGPARNIIAFTGGDLACNPEWYCQVAQEVKELKLDLWILFETNGYGLIPDHLDVLRDGGIDAFWLDIKAYDRKIHKALTGVCNDWILKLPEEILKRGFTLEVLSLFIPGVVETDQIREIAKLLKSVDKEIPFTILAFFPEYKLKNARSPNLEEMLDAYFAVREVGLVNVRLGNIGQFVKTEKDYEILLKYAKEAI